MLSLEERDRLARSTRVPAPSCQGEPFTFLCPVITRATLRLGSFQVRERGCPGRLLRPTSLWVSEFPTSTAAIHDTKAEIGSYPFGMYARTANT
jgi:hypothetical protein